MTSHDDKSALVLATTLSLPDKTDWENFDSNKCRFKLVFFTRATTEAVQGLQGRVESVDSFRADVSIFCSMRSNRIRVSLCSRSNRLQLSLQMNHQQVVIRVRDNLSSVSYEKYEIYIASARGVGIE